MKVSLSWLKEYVAIEKTEKDLANALTMAGLEVEAVANRFAELSPIRVGRITAVTPHPKADRLSVCQVDIGGHPYHCLRRTQRSRVGIYPWPCPERFCPVA